jgi:tetratricopeptide (TPR) repeat protein
LTLAGVWVAWSQWPRPAPVSPDDDPRLTFATPYRNVRPGVRYVGDQVCAGCHAAAAESYRKHPMSRSVAPVSEAIRAGRYGPGVLASFEAQGLRYRVERRGRRLFHEEACCNAADKPVASIEAEVQFVLGSGTRGRTYLVNRDGYLFESPISWYRQAHTWDLSPGYADNNPHFTRSVNAECLFCHANEADAVEHTANHYREPVFHGHAIGCERCHGPGELHVRRRQQNQSVADLDDTIVNPLRLEPALRESVCRQCHLHGEVRTLRRGLRWGDYRPGLPLELFVSVFVRPESATANKAIGQVEQLASSRCFRESRGDKKLGCLSCHDPHHFPERAEKAAYYRGRCLECHRETSCGLPPRLRLAKTKEDSCVACHMKRVTTSDVAHTAVVDHRILRVPDRQQPPVAAEPGDQLWGEYPLVPFRPDPGETTEPEAGRDLGVALVDWASSQPTRRAYLGQLALPLLTRALKERPDDVPAWEAKGYALWIPGREEEALAAFDTGLDKAPHCENALYGAALIAADLGRTDDAIAYWKSAIDVNPWNWQYHDELAKLYAGRRRWQAAAVRCRSALALNPPSWDTRKLLVRCYLRLGQQGRARAELDTLVGLGPPDPDALRRWFDEQKARSP